MPAAAGEALLQRAQRLGQRPGPVVVAPVWSRQKVAFGGWAAWGTAITWCSAGCAWVQAYTLQRAACRPANRAQAQAAAPVGTSTLLHCVPLTRSTGQSTSAPLPGSRSAAMLSAWPRCGGCCCCSLASVASAESARRSVRCRSCCCRAAAAPRPASSASRAAVSCWKRDTSPPLSGWAARHSCSSWAGWG